MYIYWKEKINKRLKLCVDVSKKRVNICSKLIKQSQWKQIKSQLGKFTAWDLVMERRSCSFSCSVALLCFLGNIFLGVCWLYNFFLFISFELFFSLFVFNSQLCNIALMRLFKRGRGMSSQIYRILQLFAFHMKIYIQL